MKNREKETEMEDEPHSEEFSFPMIAQDEVDDGSMNLSCSVWLPYTTTTSAAAATAVSECCSFPTCPHNTEVASLLISTTTTRKEEDQVEEGRTPRSSASTPKTTVKLPKSPTTTSPMAPFPMVSMWEDQEDGSGGVTPSRRRKSLLSGEATPRSFTAEEERMDMLWEEYQEHEELVAMGFVSQFSKKHWMDDDDDTDGDDEDADDGESSPYTASHSSSSSSATPTATAASNNPGSTPEMMARLYCAQVMQMSKGVSPATAVVPLRKPRLRVILRVLKKLFLLHHSHHHRSSRAKRSVGSMPCDGVCHLPMDSLSLQPHL